MPLEPLEDNDELFLENDPDGMVARYAQIYGQEQVLDSERKQFMSLRAFRAAYSRELVKAWLEHPQKKTILIGQVVFDPTNTCPSHYINLFSGLPLKARLGDYSPLLELASHLFGAGAKDSSEALRNARWVLKWLAYPLQHPGAKMATALVLAGPQGSGKSLFFSVMLRIYGPYATTIGQHQLDSRYNEWASQKLFVLAEEVVAVGEQQQHKNVLKQYVTGETIRIEGKFQAERQERNCMNMVFLSNDLRPLALESDDRRHAVYTAPLPRGDDLYKRVSACLVNGGAEAFQRFLLNLDLDNFHTHTPPPMTTAKRELVELGMRPAERFTRDWLAGQLELPLWPCSTGQLYKAFIRWSRHQGERSQANQANFTTTVSRYAGQRLSKVKSSPSQGQLGAPITLWQPEGTGPLPGVSRHDYAEQAVAAFEPHLARFAQQNGDLS